MNERRYTEQFEVYNEFGQLDYTVIPNYKIKSNFMTPSEIKMYKILVLATKEIREKYNLKLEIFAQVALNRIVEINNMRKQEELFKNISERSIDFVLYNKEIDKIHCCIELDDETHNQEKRQKRDKIIDNALSRNIKMIHIKRENNYNLESIIQAIIK